MNNNHDNSPRIKELESKSELLRICHEAVIGTMGAALSHAEHRDCSDPDVWQAVRSRILDEGNDRFRELQRQLDMFDVNYVPRKQIAYDIKDASRMEIDNQEGEG